MFPNGTSLDHRDDPEGSGVQTPGLRLVSGPSGLHDYAACYKKSAIPAGDRGENEPQGKTGREKHLGQATLKHTIEAVAPVYVMVLAQFGTFLAISGSLPSTGFLLEVLMTPTLRTTGH